ncbi:MAG: hypothetical protein ABIK96_13565 [bacterium]
MKPNICLSILFLCVLSASAVFATGIPDLSNCTVTCAYTGPGHPVMYNVPNGMGSGFDHCNIGLDVIDATIHVVLKDGNGVPISHFPAEDIWLDNGTGDLAVCGGVHCADGPTDAAGATEFRRPMAAGGFTQILMHVMVTGNQIGGPMPHHYNSPDISGDLQVNLMDVGLFASDYFGAYSFRADLVPDGVLSLSDVGRFAMALGSMCP